MKAVLITSSILILLLAALRPVLRGKIPPKAQYALWLIAALRLLLPVNLVTSAYSALALLERVDDPAPIVSAIGQISIPAQSYSSAHEQALQEYEKQLESGELVPHISQAEIVNNRTSELMRGPTVGELAARLAKPVWLGGAALMAGWFLLVNAKLRRRLKGAKRLNGVDCPLPVYVSDALPSPCLCGTFRPVIYVTPAALDDPDRLRHVLAHELTHYRHRDHWWALVRCLCLCLYWFDPLVWWAAALSRQDCELACDEGAIRALGEAERIPYGRTLVAMIAAGRNPLLQTATTMTGGKRRVRERVKLIARKPKTVAAVALALAVIIVCAVGCTFTGAPTDSSTPSSDPEPASSPSINTDDVLFQNLSFFYDDYSGVVIEGLEGSHAEWHADTSPSKGWLYFTDPGFCCPALKGRKVEGSALWADESKTTLGAVMSVNDERVVSGTVTGFYIHFTVELETGTVLTRDFASEIEGETLELDDQEMVGMAHALAKLLTAAEGYYLDNILAEADTASQAIQAVMDKIVNADEISLSLGPGGTSRVYTYEIPGLDEWQDGQVYWASHRLDSLAGGFQWQKLDALPEGMNGTCLTIQPDGGPDCIWLWDAFKLVAIRTPDNRIEYYQAVSDQYGDALGNYSPFQRLRAWFDEVELSFLRTIAVPDRGQSHEDVVNEWIEGFEESLTKCAPGSRFACTYVRAENVKADVHSFMSREDMDSFAQSREYSGDDYGKTWFTFTYQLVFAPENENARNALLAGNTEDYTGDDAPEGAQICSRVGYMELIDGNWVCEATGTGW